MKGKVIGLNLTYEDLKLFEEKAKAKGLTLVKWIRWKIMQPDPKK